MLRYQIQHIKNGMLGFATLIMLLFHTNTSHCTEIAMQNSFLDYSRNCLKLFAVTAEHLPVVLAEQNYKPFCMTTIGKNTAGTFHRSVFIVTNFLAILDNAKMEAKHCKNFICV